MEMYIFDNLIKLNKFLNLKNKNLKVQLTFLIYFKL